MEKLVILLQAQFIKMCATGILFRSEVSGKKLWEMYLKAFSKEDDPVFRDPESSTHNCNHCSNFIRRYGNIVAVDAKGKIMSLFDISCDAEYLNSMVVMDELISKSPIGNVFVETYHNLRSLGYGKCGVDQESYRLGIDKNVKRYTKVEATAFPNSGIKVNQIFTFNHIHLDVPKKFIVKSIKSVDSIMAEHKSSKDVFLRGVFEIRMDTLELVEDLIKQGSLLNGEAHIEKVRAFSKLKKEFMKVPPAKRDSWAWVKSHGLPIAKFKNELIGVLCSAISDGEELNKACKDWNKRVDPANYMKAVTPITEAQKKRDREIVESLGYLDSLNRRHATIADISVDEVKHINNGDGKIKEASIFDAIPTETNVGKEIDLNKVEAVGIQKFMSEILPGLTSVEAYLEPRLGGNMTTLTTAVDKTSKLPFAWNNHFTLTSNGNLAGKSEIRENVKRVGGNIEALVRVSLQWNDKDTPGIVDLDLHVNSEHSNIYYSNSGRLHSCGGKLDVDMINPKTVGIENIFWKESIKDGNYVIKVNNYNSGANTGFKLEISHKGGVENFEYKSKLMGTVIVATIEVIGGVVNVIPKIPSTSTKTEIYGLTSPGFHKVNLVCLSPNHWGTNDIGNKQYLFMLEGAVVGKPIRTFHSENLNSELRTARKTLESLANYTMIQSMEEQLSGLAFNATVRDSVVLRVGGSHKRLIKILF